MAGEGDLTGTPAAPAGLPAMLTCLERIVELYQRLLDLSKRKERCLVVSDLTTLDEIVSEEQQLVAETAQLEARRIRIQADLARIAGCPADRLTVSRLLDLANESEAHTLLQSQERLVHVLRELKDQNELNDLLIQQFLAYTDFALKTLQGVQRQTYDPKGQTDGAKSQTARVLDRRV